MRVHLVMCSCDGNVDEGFGFVRILDSDSSIIINSRAPHALVPGRYVPKVHDGP